LAKRESPLFTFDCMHQCWSLTVDVSLDCLVPIGLT